MVVLRPIFEPAVPPVVLPFIEPPVVVPLAAGPPDIELPPAEPPAFCARARRLGYVPKRHRQFLALYGNSSRCLGGRMKQSEQFLENAENCAQLAERASDGPTHLRYKRMEVAWRALAVEQDWLHGEGSPSQRTNEIS
jgi:hypothetical protein